MTLHTIPHRIISYHTVPYHTITLHPSTLHYITWPYVTVLNLTLRYSTSHYITLPYVTVFHIILHYSTFHSIPFYTYTPNWLHFFNLHFRNIRPRRHGGPRGASQSLNQLRVAPPNKQLWHANSMTTADLRTNIFRPKRSDQRHLGDAGCIRFKRVFHIRVPAPRSKRRKTIHDHGNDS